MQHSIGKTLLVAALATAIAGPVQAEKKSLHIYNWTDYIAPTTLKDFTRRAGSTSATTSSTPTRPSRASWSPATRL